MLETGLTNFNPTNCRETLSPCAMTLQEALPGQSEHLPSWSGHALVLKAGPEIPSMWAGMFASPARL